MSTLGFEPGAMDGGSERWDALAELMTDSAHDLGSQATGALAPSVRAAAATFLRAWSGYAAESSTMATGFADALRAAAADFWTTDQSVSGQLTELDGRLGPAR